MVGYTLAAVWELQIDLLAVLSRAVVQTDNDLNFKLTLNMPSARHTFPTFNDGGVVYLLCKSGVATSKMRFSPQDGVYDEFTVPLGQRHIS